MDSNAPGRRYSRDEMRRILEIASESRPRGNDLVESGEGFTLAEIRDIAREVGIDPARVDRASAAIRRESPLPPRVSFGTYQMETHFGRALSTEDMRFAAGEADRFFGVEGTLRHSSGLVEWHSSAAGAFVGLVREDGDTRARVIIDGSRHFLGGAALFAVLGASVFVGINAELVGAMSMLAGSGVAAATIGAVAGFWRWRKKRILRRMEQLIELMTAGLSS